MALLFCGWELSELHNGVLGCTGALALLPVPRDLPTHPHPQVFTGSSSSSWRENVERKDMLDSECSERTEMAESDLRGVPIGGCRERREGGRGLCLQATKHTTGLSWTCPPPQQCSVGGPEATSLPTVLRRALAICGTQRPLSKRKGSFARGNAGTRPVQPLGQVEKNKNPVPAKTEPEEVVDYSASLRDLCVCFVLQF